MSRPDSINNDTLYADSEKKPAKNKLPLTEEQRAQAYAFGLFLTGILQNLKSETKGIPYDYVVVELLSPLETEIFYVEKSNDFKKGAEIFLSNKIEIYEDNKKKKGERVLSSVVYAHLFLLSDGCISGVFEKNPDYLKPVHVTSQLKAVLDYSWEVALNNGEKENRSTFMDISYQLHFCSLTDNKRFKSPVVNPIKLPVKFPVTYF